MVRPVLEVADILRDHGPAWREANRGHVSLDQLKVMSAIERCRTAALGGHVARCENAACAHTLIAYNSCRNRHCPKCQAAASRRWLADREAELLPVPYFHVVYTLPSKLRDIAYQNKRVVYDLLMKAAAETTLAIASNPRRLRGSDVDVAIFDKVHAFWFGPLAEFVSFPMDRSSIWFGGGEAVDTDIAQRFGEALVSVADEPGSGALSPRQEVGRIVLIDQMSRNIHRNRPEAYALDHLAHQLAREAIRAGLDRFMLVERAFVILPLGHSESLTDQDHALDLFLRDVAPYAPAARLRSL